MTRETSPVEVLARAAIGNDALATKWLRTPSPLFGGASPMAASATVEGYQCVKRLLAWFAGESFRRTAQLSEAENTVDDLLSDPMMDLVLKRAGTGPEELLSLCREIALHCRAA